MNYPFWAFNKENDEYTNYLYAVIGKALMICTRFECYCKNIDLLLQVKRKIIMEEVFDNKFLLDLSEKINKKRLFHNIAGFSGTDFYKDLIDVKNIRNEIIHDITKGLDAPVYDEKTYDTTLKELKKKLQKVLCVERKLILLICHITNEIDYPNDNYIKNNLNWVFNDRVD